MRSRLPRFSVLLCTVLGYALFSHAQEQISFGQLSIKDGLSQNCGISIAQDSAGYLWIATQDGLNRYDGNDFTIYPYIFADITRPDYSELGKVYIDRENQVWCIPASRRLNRLIRDKNEFETVTLVNDASILLQDDELGYWIGTHNNGLLYSMLNETHPEIQHITKNKETVYALSQYGNSILAATASGIVIVGIQSKEVDKVLNKTADGKKIGSRFSTIAVEAGERQWFGTFGSGLYFRDSEDTLLKSVSDLSPSIPGDLNILSLFADSKNRLWIGTYGDGIFLLDLENYEVKHFMANKYNPKAIHYNDILSIYEDYTGTIWFGTDGAGLSYYDEYLEKFNSITNSQVPLNINVEVIRAITTDSMGSVWLGTSGKGLMKYTPDSKSWFKYATTNPPPTRLPSDRIMSFLVDSRGDLWIGTQGGGLSKLAKDGTIINYLDKPELGLEAITIWDIFEDTSNRLWLGTRENGLVQFNRTEGQLRAYNQTNVRESLSINNNIRVITEDGQGNLWLGTDSDGLIYFNLKEKSTRTYKAGPEGDGLNSNMIKSLYYSNEEGILWIGTYGGGLNALLLDDGKFHAFTEEDGLANNVIYAVLPDSEGNLWLSSNRGITRFTPGSSLDEEPEITNYTNYEGLATEFNTGAYHIDQNGVLYFGGLEGFYWFNPDNIQENNQLPKTAITGMQVDNVLHPMRNGLALNHKKNTISFNFSSLQFSLPEKNQYRYRLRDFEEDWIESGNTNFARYSNLPPGDYEFQVVSSNYDGVWNPKPATFAFTIVPPWYLSTAAKVVYLLLLILAVFLVYRYLKWRWKMKLDLQLKEEETLRLKQLDDLKSKLYTDISHEIRTPLTLISGPIDAKLNEKDLDEGDRASFSMIKRNANRLMELIDQMLNLAKLEKGSMEIKVDKGNLGRFLEMLAEFFQHKAGEKEIDYIVDIEPMEEVWFDKDSIEKIVINLLTNAFKYCTEGGIVSFSAVKIGNEAQIDVKNTVHDFSAEDLDKVFNRFYQQDEFADGIGVGLSLVRQLTTLYKGDVRAELENDETICFQVRLPVAIDDFSPEQRLDDKQSTGSSGEAISRHVGGVHPQGNQTNPAADELPIVLIVEDHSEVRQFLVSAWEGKFRIYEAENGQAGITTALKVIPDLIVSDVRMPMASGIDLCNTLKADERTSHIPILLLTAGAGEEAELKGLESGADDFVAKPFKLPLLEKRVENLIASRRALRSRYRQEVALKARDIAITPTDELFLNKVQQLIDERLSEAAFNAAKFAAAVGMSRMQLHRKLKAITGLSTTEFIRSQRLKQAAQILRTSDAAISEVAYTVGFNTPSYFIKCFKEVYGKTPAEYLQTAE